MRVGKQFEKNGETIQNRKQFFNRHNISETEIVTAQLVHGNNVTVVSKKDAGHHMPQTDGLLTDQKGLVLSITVADCLPIFLYDPEKKVVGLLHAGWRGLDAKIIYSAIELLKKRFAVLPENLIVGIGPGIGPCHFAVHEDVLEKFSNYPNTSEKRNNEYFLDLKQIAKQQLIAKNVQTDHIEINNLCTYCEKNMYFSHRRDKTNPIQTMVAGIAMI